MNTYLHLLTAQDIPLESLPLTAHCVKLVSFYFSIECHAVRASSASEGRQRVPPLTPIVRRSDGAWHQRPILNISHLRVRLINLHFNYHGCHNQFSIIPHRGYHLLDILFIQCFLKQPQRGPSLILPGVCPRNNVCRLLFQYHYTQSIILYLLLIKQYSFTLLLGNYNILFRLIMIDNCSV